MDITSKAELRQALLAKRRLVDPAERQAAGEQAATVFHITDIFRHSQHIACYYPRVDEFDCLPIIQHIWAANKKCYLPLLASKTDKILDFVNYYQDDILQPNRYQILEPVQVRKIALEELDIVLFPLVGFDTEGNRLGMGGGYYDRTFEMMRAQNNKKCYFIGLAYESQHVPVLPHDPWDVALDGVLTEKRMIIF